MVVEKVEDLKLWQRAKEFWRRTGDVLTHPAFQRDRDMSGQLRRAADSIVSNIEEGFEQPTDKAFANYLYVAKSSNAEARGRLKRALDANYISAGEFDILDGLACEIARMTVGLIKHLVKSNRRNRRLGRKETAVPPGEPSVDGL